MPGELDDVIVAIIRARNAPIGLVYVYRQQIILHPSELTSLRHLVACECAFRAI